MLIKQQKQLVTYKKIIIYERTYKLPVLKNTKLKSIQKKIKERRRLIKEGVRYHQLLGIIKLEEKISQEKIFQESQLLIKDYTYLINFLENYQDSYQVFLLKLTDDLKKLFIQKYQEIKNLDSQRKKLEIKNYKNQKILTELKWEKQENFKALLLLSNACFLMLEKIKLLSEGLKLLSEDTKNQKQIVQQIIKDLEAYQEIYEYQRKAQKVRQEIVEIVEMAINFEHYLQSYFSPFQSLIDEVVKVDEDFYAIVGDIKTLVDNILNFQSDLLIPEKTNGFSETFLDFMVSIYEKKERLEDALIQCRLLDGKTHNFDLINNPFSLSKEVDLISNHISKQLAEQRKEIEIAKTNFVSILTLPAIQATELVRLTNEHTSLVKEVKNKKKIDYTKLQDFLAQQQWKKADIETTKLMLKVMGKSGWNEVYKKDIENFSCKDIHIIDQLWEEYSHGYFGFSIQQSIWSEMGGQVDYETEKLLGDRLGWRKQGNWLDYNQLSFELSSTTPIGHLPVQWLYYDSIDLSPKSSAQHLSMGAWRVGSWLAWQMHLFLSRAKICNETFLDVDNSVAKMLMGRNK